jgi:hypothetical protein
VSKLNLTNEQKLTLAQYAEWAESEANNSNLTQDARYNLMAQAAAYRKLRLIDLTHINGIQKEIQRAF